ncbi:uncharacterized protein LOC106752719 [Vigna radiata var. radiata]|uniref:Uncharacterized protein LOC106752719 n=1 Tax=Vigna radiata var. radiata TaxID=3916 RepID=A0A1S3T850_VIGRR|nr:uncharacterized protein LOC106752719 [Vigna radiata var. radiata]
MGQASSSRPPPPQFQQQPTDRTSKLEETLQQFMQMSLSNQKSTDASIRNLEVQMGQLAKKLEEKPVNTFRANTEPNPIEHCKAITTRSGKVLESVVVRKEGENEKSSEEHEKKEEKKDKERQMDRFKKIFNELEITLPLTEALQQIPAYAKYVKKFLSKKKKYLDKETIEVQGNCSAIMQKSLPPKVKDPGSFTIPCTIGNHNIGKALVDLGASINLMPLSMLKKIGNLEVKSTRMILQMADRSIKHPYGVVEDVVIKVDKLKFPVDFVVMEMEEGVDIPLILGRPFMKTAKVVIHVDDGTVKLKDQDEEVTFNVFEYVKQSQEEKTSYKVKYEVLAVTSLPRQVVKLTKKNLNCFNPKVKERDEDKEEQRVHQESDVKNDELKPGKPVSHKNRLWVIKDIKVNGVLEIEAPYSRRIKLVTRKLLRKCWCHERKKHTNIKNPT